MAKLAKKTHASILEQEMDVQKGRNYISWTVCIKHFQQPRGNHSHLWKCWVCEECVCKKHGLPLMQRAKHLKSDKAEMRK